MDVILCKDVELTERNASGTSQHKLSLSEFGDSFIKLLICAHEGLTEEQKRLVYDILAFQVKNFDKAKGVGALVDHIMWYYNVALVTVKISSLEIILDCPSLESLEHIWSDYLSGDLNKVVERYLVTDEIKKKLNLETIHFITTIEEKNYLECKEVLMGLTGEAARPQQGAPETRLTTITDDAEQHPEDCNKTASHSFQQCTIVVTGLPHGTTEEVVLNYFENPMLSMGGPVSRVEMNPASQTCQLTFESADDAFRTVEHSPHNLCGAHLHVSLLEQLDEEEKEDTRSFEENAEEVEEATNIIVSSPSPSTSLDAVRNYFDNSRRSGAGKVLKIEAATSLTFGEVKDQGSDDVSHGDEADTDSLTAEEA